MSKSLLNGGSSYEQPLSMSKIWLGEAPAMARLWIGVDSGHGSAGSCKLHPVVGFSYGQAPPIEEL